MPFGTGEHHPAVPGGAAGDWKSGRQNASVPFLKFSRAEHLHDTASATLGLGNYRKAVKLPANCDNPDDWIAVQLFEIYAEAVLVSSVISDFCTPKTCPKMTAGMFLCFFML